MIHNLLAATAIVSVLSTASFAESAKSTSENKVDNPVLYEFEVTTTAPAATRGFLASNMIGKAIKSQQSADGEEIGDVNDVILGRDGSVQAVIVGVGGFLGMGEKEVAIEFDRLNFVSERDGEFHLVSDVSQSELEAADAYERPDYVPQWMTVSVVETEMDKISQRAQKTYETVRKEAVDPAKKRLDAAIADWTAEKTRVDAETVSTEALIDAAVYTSEDENIGEISQILLDESGKAEAVVIDVGGFLGFNEKPVAVSYDSLMLFETDNGAILVVAPFTKEELENAKTFEPAGYKANPEGLTLKS